MISDFVKIKHLLNRAGFGLSPIELEWARKVDLVEIIDIVLKPKYSKIELKGKELKELSKKLDIASALSSEEKKLKRRALFQLQSNWMDKMVVPFTEGPVFLERMSLFWHGHFACRIKDYRFASNHLEIIRKNALGNFRDLLLSISKDAGMIRYLNNQQNLKNKPNENFARELLELFSIGEGNYTEKDIKEAARAFTGWTATIKGEFVLRKKHYDGGVKHFMGVSGKFDGENIIDIILRDQRTAYFIASKVYAYFVNHEANEANINELANVLYQSNYEIEPMMRTLFSSDWFYSEENIGTKVKSPVDLIIGLRKLFDIRFSSVINLVYLQRILGQELFNPPNVAGWMRDLRWINNATLIYRIKLGHILLSKENYELATKAEQEGFNFNNKLTSRFKNLRSNFTSLILAFENIREDDLESAMSSYFLSTDRNKEVQLLDSNTVNNKETIIQILLRLTAYPEFQFS